MFAQSLNKRRLIPSPVVRFASRVALGTMLLFCLTGRSSSAMPLDEERGYQIAAEWDRRDSGWEDQTAEEELGATYEEIDDILEKLESPYLRNKIDLLDTDTISKKKLAKIKQIIETNAHKAKPLKVCTIDTKF